MDPARPDPISAKLRTKKYQESHKDAIAERRKAKRVLIKELLRVHYENHKDPIEQKIEVAEVKQAKRVRPGIAPAVHAMPDEAPDEDTVLFNKATNKTDKNSIVQLTRILECEESDFPKVFLDSKNTIKKIEQATLKNSDEKYSVNSVKSFMQTLCKIITKTKMALPQKTISAYQDIFAVYKLKSIKEGAKKKADSPVMTYEEYLPLVKKAFGEVSKEYIIASLYELYGLRDNLCKLKIVPAQTPQNTDDHSHNYIVIPNDGGSDCKMLYNTYKTWGKYGNAVIQIPAKLSSLIRKYFNKSTLDYDDYLFGSSLLSGFISEFNQSLGLNVTINTLRQMTVSNALPEDASEEDIVAVARKMHHAPGTTGGALSA